MERTCVICGTQFKLLPDHRGYATRCSACNEGVEEPERVGGCTSWEGKHTPVLEITSMKKARAFSRKTKRYGVSVTRSIVESQMTGYERGEVGGTSEAAERAEYYSPLGEKRSVKNKSQQ